MKNRKGITTVELIISITLISVILIFLFKVIIDVRYEKNASFARKNNVVRTEIINTIQKDFVLLGVNNVTKSGNTIRINYLDSTNKNLVLTSTTATYGDHKWTFVEGTIDLNNIQIEIDNSYKSSIGRYYIIITIPVLYGNTNNKMDDIELFYLHNG